MQDLQSLKFNTPEEANAYMQSNGMSSGYKVQQNAPAQTASDPYVDNINMLYQFAQANPNNTQLANAFMGALMDYYSPTGSKYQAEQQQRATAMDEAKMLGSFENNPAADAASLGIISQYYPSLQQNSSVGSVDPYQLFREAQLKKINALKTSDNFDPMNQNSMGELSKMAQVYNLTPEQYNQYKAPVTAGEWLSMIGYKGNNAEGARLKRVGL